ncbi:hypothetical protein SAMN04489752_0996 [Brevibacterium siliguriense]|uniref:Nudix hydrolase domain-containing protein n=1 Tax=Brevibacterium siliguriense TaxID=1136497 RepID=A0A1H1PHR3_9MICO|nr:hypothetical protein SAMN04489752_0996 [Brevibacterium siliguriense]
MSDQILVSAVVFSDEAGRILTVRKRGAELLMFPGGKPETGESSEQAAVREVAEELGVELDATCLRLIGEFTAPAANEPGQDVRATVFEHPWVRVDSPRAEIEQIEWVHPSAEAANLAPLLRETVFPRLRNRHRLGTVAVFTGSAFGNTPEFAQAAEVFARKVATAGISIVYGGGEVGLMGVVADSALAVGGTVHGVIPQSLVDGEIGHSGLTRLDVVADMHARKSRMAELADGFVALPGGAGTLEELFEVWTWQQLGLHTKPIALYDVGGFWQPFLAMVDQMVASGFISSRFRDSLIVSEEPDALLAELARWRPQAPKWDGSVDKD